MQQKQINVDGIEITVIKKKMKNMYLRVLPPDGRVQITAPLRTSDARIIDFVRWRFSWIKVQQEKIRAHPRARQIAYETGDIVFLWGQQYRLEICEPGTEKTACKAAQTDEWKSDKTTRKTAQTCEWKADRKSKDLEKQASGKGTVRASVSISLETQKIPKTSESEILGTIYLRAASDSTAQQREHILNEWYRKQLKRAIPPVMEKYERIIGVQAKEWRVKNMKTRWGTCNTGKARIWLNLQLVKLPPKCLEYVVAHELTHLLEPSHNRRFYELLDRFYPDWKAVKNQMR